jgi:hypothetical protein
MTASQPATARWLLLIHQLPPSPAYVRVKTARQLQKIGAVAVKNSVYVLPNTDASNESFAWLAKEIASAGGEATLCESSFVGGTSDEAVEALFQRARGHDYQELAGEVRTVLKSLGKSRRLDETKRAAATAALARFRRRAADIAALDFFHTPDGEAVAAVVDSLEGALREADGTKLPAAEEAPPAVKGVIWVTRKGVHIDRIASAWLIKRFIDPDAKLKFVPAKGYAPKARELRFDMFEAEYTHEGDRCTFEVLARRFAVTDSAVGAIGEVIHDIDVRDGKFERPETPGIERLINGVALTNPDDEARIALGGKIFDALYAAWRKRRT